jgi:hypothetical protein
VPISSTEWLDGHADRTFARQRAQVDTGKLVATFSSAVVATVVATALQVGSPSGWDKVAVALLALSFGAALIVILLDRLTEANESAIVQVARIQSWPDARLLQELRIGTLTAGIANEGVVRSVRVAVVAQVTTSLFGGAAAIVSLL